MTLYRPQAARLLRVAVLASMLPLSAPAAPALRFETPGGDAWSFEQQVSGHAPAGCEQLRVSSPAGTVPAWREDGRFSAEVPLHGGLNRVQASCRTADGKLLRSPEQHWRVRLADTPKAWVRTRVAGGEILLDAGRSERAPGRPAPIVRYEWRALPGNPAPLHPAEGGPALGAQARTGEQLRLQAPTVDGEYYLSLRAVDALGRVDEARSVFRVEDGRAQEVDLESEHPAWLDGATLYGVVPFFFGEAGYESVQARLDEIAALGVRAIWLSPVNATPADDFGYAVTDHFRLRETFGDEAQFRALVESAHARGLRVIMDFVPNHFSDQHPYYLDAEARGEASPYHDWFERDAQGEVLSYFDWDNLKNLDYDNREVQNYIIAAAAYWVREFGMDGFRVDAGWGVRERAPEFWERWREELKRVDPDLFLLVEASARDGYYLANGFDAAYDWSSQLGQWAWKDVFGETGEAVDLARLRDALTNLGNGYPPDTLILRFLNNNDTCARFITRHGPALTRVAAALTFTLPGVPLVYTGDEVGAEYEPYDEGPPLSWQDPQNLSGYYARLIELRRRHRVLWSRELELVRTDRDDSVLAYRRPAVDGQGEVLVVLNFGDRPVQVALAGEPLLADGRARDLLGGEIVQAPGGRLAVPAYGVRVLQD